MAAFLPPLAPPGGAFLPAYQPLSEDSCALKTLAMIPLVGMIPRVFVNNSLVGKLAGNLDPAKAIEIIRVKNDYKTAGIVSSMILTALIIAGMATGIIAGALGITIGIISILLNGMSNLVTNNDITQNNGIIRDLAQTGHTNSQIR